MQFALNPGGQRASYWDPIHGWEVQGQTYWGSTPVEFYEASVAHFQPAARPSLELLRTAAGKSRRRFLSAGKAPRPFSPAICTARTPDGSLSRDTVSMSTLTYQGLEVLFSRQQIADRVAEMGEQITHDLNGEKLVMIGVLKGGGSVSL